MLLIATAFKPWIPKTQNEFFGFSHHRKAKTPDSVSLKQMKNLISRIYFLLLLIALATLSSCDDEAGFDYEGNHYFNSITELDLTSINDCNLPLCSKDRIKRFHFNEVFGYLSQDNVLSVSGGRYLAYELSICNPDKIRFSPNSYVIFTGSGRDGCGYITPGGGEDLTIIGLSLEIASIQSYP